MSKAIDLIIRVHVADRAIENESHTVNHWLLDLGSKFVGNDLPALNWNGIEATEIYTHIEDNGFDLSIMLRSSEYKVVDNYVYGLVGHSWFDTGIKVQNS